MHSLQHLHNDGVHIPLDVLGDCTFKLHTLIWNCDMNKQAVSVLLHEILPTQHSIKILRLGPAKESDAIDDMADVATNICPNLRYLSASNDTITRALLRDDRLVTRFQWHKKGCLPNMTSRQLKALRYLLLSGVQDLNKDSNFASRLTSLVILEIRGDRNQFFGLPRLVR